MTKESGHLRTKNEIDRDGLYIAVTKTEMLRQNEPPLVVLAFINIQLAVRRRSKSLLRCYRTALEGVRRDVIKTISPGDLRAFAVQLKEHQIRNADDVAYVKEFVDVFPALPEFAEALARARREWRRQGRKLKMSGNETKRRRER